MEIGILFPPRSSLSLSALELKFASDFRVAALPDDLDYSVDSDGLSCSSST